MKTPISENDKKNLAAIAAAEEQGRINAEAREYLVALYSDSMRWFREVFYVLGKCFGAPKAGIMPYDPVTGHSIDESIKIADINPLSFYMVHHRLDADPMRNQFFTVDDNNRVNLSVSSIVSVIVGGQKKIERTLEKITGKYYDDYVNNVADAASDVLKKAGREASGRAIADKIHEKFGSKFITNASETVLEIIGRGHEKIAVEMVRELDKITKPHLRLKDVWRVKCLFDLVPQARTFIERIREVSADKIIEYKDKFYSFDTPRNYRDAKIILNIGSNGSAIPLEIICQVRTFFDFEKGTHDVYEKARKKKNVTVQDVEHTIAMYHEDGVRQYNTMIAHCLDDLFERVGWNILYGNRPGESLVDGFPRISKPRYPARVIDAILDKLDNGVENEVFRIDNAPRKLSVAEETEIFRIDNAPRKLSVAEETEIFRWMALFVLVSAVPYKDWDWKVPGDGQAIKFFNFIMNELRRYYIK